MLKRIFTFLAYVIAMYYILLHKFISFYAISLRIAYVPYRLGEQIRFHFYKRTLKHVGKNVLFSFGTVFTNKEITIGNNVRFGPFNTIGNADFGDNILIAQYVHFMSGSHQHGYKRDELIMNQSGLPKKIYIGSDVWIGVNSVIMNDVGEGSVVGAGSIVVSSIENYSIAVGNPCKRIRER